MEKISRERFIRLGTALGVGAASASLAACGGGAASSGGGGSGGKKSGGDSGGGNSGGDYGGAGSEGGSSDRGSKSKSSSSGDGAQTGGAAIASASEVAPGNAVTFKDAGNPAVLVHLENGDFVAYSAICTHQGCIVGYKNGQLACPCHGSVFDPARGAKVVAGPAPRPLPEIPVKVEGGEVVKG